MIDLLVGTVLTCMPDDLHPLIVTGNCTSFFVPTALLQCSMSIASITKRPLTSPTQDIDTGASKDRSGLHGTTVEASAGIISMKQRNAVRVAELDRVARIPKAMRIRPC